MIQPVLSSCHLAHPALSNVIAFSPRPPCDGIGNPAIDLGLPPTGSVDADSDLGGERSLSDLSIDGGAGQARPGEDGIQADDTVWCGHGCDASGWRFLTALCPVRTGPCRGARGFGELSRRRMETAANRTVLISRSPFLSRDRDRERGRGPRRVVGQPPCRCLTRPCD